MSRYEVQPHRWSAALSGGLAEGEFPGGIVCFDDLTPEQSEWLTRHAVPIGLAKPLAEEIDSGRSSAAARTARTGEAEREGDRG